MRAFAMAFAYEQWCDLIAFATWRVDFLDVVSELRGDDRGIRLLDRRVDLRRWP